jgi:putative flippase GtrA
MRRLFSYGVVGVIASAIYILCTVILIETFGLAPITSSGLSYIASFLFSFFANHHIVFKSKENISKTIIRFAVVSVFGFCLTTLIMFLIVGIFKLPYPVGIALVLVAIPLSNFLFHLRWTFKIT